MDKPNETEPSEFDRLSQAYQVALRDGDPSAIEATNAAILAYAARKESIETAEGALCRQEAQKQEAVWQWDKAEAAYRRAVALAHEQNHGAMVLKANLELYSFYRFIGQTEKALEAADAALTLARSSGAELLIGMALECRVFCLLDQKDTFTALQNAEEMVRTLFASNPVHEVSDTQKARALILRADCLTEQGQVTRAAQDLAIALPLLERLSGATALAGVQKGLAHWWEVTARGAFLQSDFPASADAWRASMTYRRVVAQSDHLEGPYKFAALSRSLRRLGAALLLVGDWDGSSRALNESHDIQAVIKQPAAGFAL